MSILGPTGGGRLVTSSDPDSILAVQSEVQFRIDRGEFFTVGLAQLVPSNSAANVLIQVGDKPMHAVMAGSVAQNMNAELWEGTVFSDAGSGVIPYNRLRSSSNTSASTVTVAPTSANFGTRIFSTFIPGGSKGSANGGDASTFSEWVLQPNTNYLMRIINNVVSPSTAGMASISLDYYETDTT